VIYEYAYTHKTMLFHHHFARVGANLRRRRSARRPHILAASLEISLIGPIVRTTAAVSTKHNTSRPPI